MKLSHLFENCLNAKYVQVENAVNYSVERVCSTLYIYFEWSKGCADWKNNLDFPAKPYKRMGDEIWFAHRGFLRAWKTVEGYVSDSVTDRAIKKVVTVGYSHGAALAALCHEYVWFNRPDLRDRIEGYGFGCPRVLWGVRTKRLAQRWGRFLVIRNINDLVTHLPPAVFGFSHVGELLEIGERRKYGMIDAHRPENILAELYNYEVLSCQSGARECLH